MLRRRQVMGAGVLAGVGATAWAAEEDHTGGDPLGSMQWPELRKKYMGGAPMQFTDKVIVRTPAFADDAMNVPLQVDARALSGVGGGIKSILVMADRNPIHEILTFEPLRSEPVLAFRIKLEQGSPIRALVQTKDGQWHVGGSFAQAAGGGCTVPGLTRADGSWSKTLNQVHAKFFSNVLDGPNNRRLRVQIMHPMDTGLVAGIPAFHIEHLELLDGTGQAWWRMELHEPISENPLITFEMPKEGPKDFILKGRDNGGNRIEAEVRA